MKQKPELSNHCIVNWDLYHKINRTAEKTLKSLKYLINDDWENRITDQYRIKPDIDNKPENK